VEVAQTSAPAHLFSSNSPVSKDCPQHRLLRLPRLPLLFRTRATKAAIRVRTRADILKARSHKAAINRTAFHNACRRWVRVTCNPASNRRINKPDHRATLTHQEATTIKPHLRRNITQVGSTTIRWHNRPGARTASRPRGAPWFLRPAISRGRLWSPERSRRTSSITIINMDRLHEALEYIRHQSKTIPSRCCYAIPAVSAVECALQAITVTTRLCLESHWSSPRADDARRRFRVNITPGGATCESGHAQPRNHATGLESPFVSTLSATSVEADDGAAKKSMCTDTLQAAAELLSAARATRGSVCVRCKTCRRVHKSLH
jgi:hypothetical protein